MTNPLSLENAVKDETSIRKRGAWQPRFALDAASVGRPSASEVRVLQVVASTVGLAEAVLRGEVGRRWVGDGVVEGADDGVVQLLRQVCRRVQPCEETQAVCELK